MQKNNPRHRAGIKASYFLDYVSTAWFGQPSAQESDINLHSLKTKEGNIILTSHSCVFLLMPILIPLAHSEIIKLIT
jgi:hydroxylamine reductase (hybrid-cluster protein)